MFLRWLNRIVDGLIILFATIIVTVVSAEVILRYAFGQSLIFTDELARYLMVWVVFLGSAVAFRDNSHISIGLLVDSRRPPTKKALIIVGQLLCLAFLAVLLVEAVKLLPDQAEQACITLPLNMAVFYLAIPVGCGLMILTILVKMKRSLWPAAPTEAEAGEGR